MTAQTLDGTATLKAIKAELAERVAALKERGVTPGLGTVLVGDDPGSHWYVGAKHKDCAEIGIESIRRDLPATATQAEVEAVIDELNADPPAPASSSSSRPGSTSSRCCPASTPTRTSTGCTRSTSAGWCWASRARCPARRSASSSCCAATASRSRAPR